MILTQQFMRMECNYEFIKIWHIPECLVNLISLHRLNDLGVHCNNKTWERYIKKTREVIEYVPRINNSHVFTTMNTFNNPKTAIHLIRVDNSVYHGLSVEIYFTRSKLPLTIQRPERRQPRIGQN